MDHQRPGGRIKVAREVDMSRASLRLTGTAVVEECRPGCRRSCSSKRLKARHVKAGQPYGAGENNAEGACESPRLFPFATMAVLVSRIETYARGNQRYYVGVWRTGKDAYYLWNVKGWKAFTDKWKELGAQNMRLISLDSG